MDNIEFHSEEEARKFTKWLEKQGFSRGAMMTAIAKEPEAARELFGTMLIKYRAIHRSPKIIEQE